MKQVKRIIFPIFVLLILTIPRALEAETIYRILMMGGDVTITSGGKARKAAVKSVLKKNDIIICGKKSFADISAGDRGMIRLQEKSRLSIDSLMEKSKDSTIGLIFGKVLVVLSKLSKDSSFEVKTRTQTASIRGTTFQVEAKEDESRLDVITGSVVVHPVSDGKTIREISQQVEKNQSVVMTRDMVKKIMTRRMKIKVMSINRNRLKKLKGSFNNMRKSQSFRKFNRTMKRKGRSSMQRGAMKKRMNSRIKNRQNIRKQGSRAMKRTRRRFRNR